MASPRTKLRELALLARDDVDALRDTLREDAGSLGAVLGVSDTELVSLAERADGDVSKRVLAILDHVRRHAVAQNGTERERRAFAAARELALGARWLDAGAELDPRIVLGELLVDGSKPWVGFLVDGAEIIVSRARLRGAALAMRPFCDLRALVDEQALQLRWRRGLGGLNFRSQAAEVRDASLTVRVVIERPRVQPAPVVFRPRPRPTAPCWLTDALAELIG